VNITSGSSLGERSEVLQKSIRMEKMQNQCGTLILGKRREGKKEKKRMDDGFSCCLR